MTKSPKKPKRYGNPRNNQFPKQPDGTWSDDLRNEQFETKLGQIVAYWPHVEEQMIEFFGLLLGSNTPARQVFRAIVAQHSRIKVMRALLERSQQNKDKSEEYDAIISEFESLNDRRNAYVHGLWTTHESARVFLAESSIEDGHFFKSREVLIEEVTNVQIRMRNLWRRVMVLKYPEYVKHFPMEPLLEIPQPPPDRETL